MKYKICLSISKKDTSFAKMEEELKKYAEVDVVGLDGFTLEGYDVYIGKKLSRKILKTADKLKAAFAYKTGVDDFPMDMLSDMGVTLINSHIDADYIAEYAFGLGISLVNRITECDKNLRKGIWYDAENPYWESIFDMKVGLLGYGHIGRHLHEILKKNDIEAYTIDRGKEYQNIKLVKDLKELCENTDLIVISLPKTPETDLMLDGEIFKLLKGKYIVNVGRSNCIDQGVLYEVLKSKYIGGAAIDTWDKKPRHKDEYLEPSKYPLIELDNIVMSPHQAMRVAKGHERYVMDTLEKVIDYIKTGNIKDVVDLKKGY